MIVHKSTVVNVKNGTPKSITEALANAGLPENAVATKIESQFDTVETHDYLLHSFVTYSAITFEWDDDE